MLPIELVAGTVLLYLISFWVINLINMILSRSKQPQKRAFAEIQRPSGFLVALGLIGTLAFFIVALILISLTFLGFGALLSVSPLQLTFPFDTYVQACGLIVIGCGWFIFLWSVISRGRFSVAWEMREDHQLITHGPYRFIRHPSYLGYFLMFIGFFFAWLNLLTLITWLGIPGYYEATKTEEELLVQRFGEEYTRYQSQTGRFLPKIRKRRGEAE